MSVISLFADLVMSMNEERAIKLALNAKPASKESKEVRESMEIGMRITLMILKMSLIMQEKTLNLSRKLCSQARLNVGRASSNASGLTTPAELDPSALSTGIPLLTYGQERLRYWQDNRLMDPFNLRRERESGFFDLAGFYHPYIGPQEEDLQPYGYWNEAGTVLTEVITHPHDRWLDGVTVNLASAPAPAPAQHAPASNDTEDVRARILASLKGEESIADALRRIKGVGKRMPPGRLAEFEQLNVGAHLSRAASRLVYINTCLCFL